MEVATILPIPYLHLTARDQYHMCLAHLVKKSEKYADYYREMSNKGEFVLMDNGAAEGEQLSIDEIIECAWKVQPKEIVLLDSIHSRIETVAKSKYSKTKLEEALPPATHFMGVPHGETWPDVVRCAEQLIEDVGVHSIGISKFLSERYGPMARLQLLEDQPMLARREVHLLGCHHDPREIGYIQKYHNIRGTDSAIAWVYTKAGIDMSRSASRPKIHVDFYDHQVCPDLLQRNIDTWKEWCHGRMYGLPE